MDCPDAWKGQPTRTLSPGSAIGWRCYPAPNPPAPTVWALVGVNHLVFGEVWSEVASPCTYPTRHHAAARSRSQPLTPMFAWVCSLLPRFPARTLGSRRGGWMGGAATTSDFGRRPCLGRGVMRMVASSAQDWCCAVAGGPWCVFFKEARGEIGVGGGLDAGRGAWTRSLDAPRG